MRVGLAFNILCAVVTIALGASIVTATEDASLLKDSRIFEIRAMLHSDPQRAEIMARALESDAAKDSNNVRRSNSVLSARWLRAEALIQLTRLDEAARIVDTALHGLEASQLESKVHGDLLMSRASIGTMRGDAGRTLVDLQHAFRIYGSLDNAQDQARALQFMGLIYQNAGDYSRVIAYYEQADELPSSSLGMKLASSNNQGDALSALRRFDEAELQYRKALRIARQLGNRLLEARILDNIARTQISAGKLNAAGETLRDGLALTRTAAAAEWHPLMLGTAARLAVERRQYITASQLLTRAVPSVGPSSASQPYQELHQTAYRTFRQLGEQRRALDHFEAYTALDREGRALASSVNASLLAARFDFANQNSRIATLKAGQLERDIALERLQARQRALLLWALLAIVTIVAAVLTMYLRTVQRSRDAIRRANATLSDSNAQLEQALLAKSQFLATTSHEIRTPLNGVLGMTQVLLKDPGISADVRERLQLLYGAGDAMRVLVDDLLQLAKLDAGDRDVEIDEMDLHQLLRDTVAFWRGQATGKGLTLTLSIENVPQLIFGDIAVYRQILSNLLSNAIKFTIEGEVSVTASVIGINDRERLLIRITDSGIGIPSQAFDVIFEKFHQLDSSTTRRFAGTGLGLAISRELASALSGEISVESELGRGSTFTLSLALDRVPAAASPAFGAAVQRRPAGLRDAAIAIVGGKPIAQSVFRAVLLPNVARFTVVDDLEAAVRLAEQSAADIMVIDGSEFLERDAASLLYDLGRLKGFGVKSILVCGTAEAAMRPVLLAAGASAVVIRPMSGKTLLTHLNDLYERSNLDEPSAIAC